MLTLTYIFRFYINLFALKTLVVVLTYAVGKHWHLSSKREHYRNTGSKYRKKFRVSTLLHRFSECDQDIERDTKDFVKLIKLCNK